MVLWPLPGWNFCLFCYSQVENYPLALITIEIPCFGGTHLQMEGESFGMSLDIIIFLGRKEVGPYVIIIKVYLCSKIISSSVVRVNLSHIKSEQVNAHFLLHSGAEYNPWYNTSEAKPRINYVTD